MNWTMVLAKLRMIFDRLNLILIFFFLQAMSIFKKVFVEVFFFQEVFFHQIFSTIKFLFYYVWFLLKNRKKFGKCSEYFTTNSLNKKCTIFVAIIVRHQLKLGNYFGILIRIFMTLAIIFMVSEKEQASRLYASKHIPHDRFIDSSFVHINRPHIRSQCGHRVYIVLNNSSNNRWLKKV